MPKALADLYDETLRLRFRLAEEIVPNIYPQVWSLGSCVTCKKKQTTIDGHRCEKLWSVFTPQGAFDAAGAWKHVYAVTNLGPERQAKGEHPSPLLSGKVFANSAKPLAMNGIG